MTTANIKMMFKLAKVLFKGSSYTNNTSNGLKKNNNKWIYIILPIVFIPMALNIVNLAGEGFLALQPSGDEYLIIKAYLALSSLITLFLGFFYSISILFFSTDNDILSHLPLHSWQICGARFMVILLYEYLFEAFIFLPFTLTFGIMAKAGILFFLYSIIAFVILPVLPISLLAVIVMLLMRFIPFFKSKDKVNMLSTVLTLVLILGIYLPFMNNFSSTAIDEGIASLFYAIAGGPKSIGGVLQYILPPLGFAFNALNRYDTFNGSINIILAIVISIAGFIFFMASADLLYVKASSGITDSKAKHKKLSEQELSGKIKKNSVIRTLIMKEIRLVMRSPVYFMNCVLMAWIWPLIFGIGFFMGDDIGIMLNEAREFMGQNIGSYAFYILIGVAFVSVFVASTSCFTSSAISREGSQISFSKLIPVPYYSQLKAKLLASLILCAVPNAVIFMILGLLFNCGLYSLLFAAVSFITFSYSSAIGLLVDMGRPKLIWDNEQAAVKQNINSLIAIALSIPVCGVIVILSVIPTLLPNIGTLIALAVHVAAAVAANFILFAIIRRDADKCYDNIQI